MFFDFLYYHIYKFYSKYKEKGAASTSAGIVGGFQAINILTLVLLFKLLTHRNDYISTTLVIVLFIIFQITTYYRYIYKENHSTIVLEKEWETKAENSRKRIFTMLYIYGGISIVACFSLAIYLGNLRNN